MEQLRQQLGEKIDYILDGGDCRVGVESTIIGFEKEKIIEFTVFHIFISNPLFTLADEGTPVFLPGLKIRYFYGLYRCFFLIKFGEIDTLLFIVIVSDLYFQDAFF